MKHYHENSTAAAWDRVNAIFPTDYARDAMKSARAGYDIYTSTAEGVEAWISDLGARLEVNLPDGGTVNVWIDDAARVTEEAVIDPDDVRGVCIKYGLYTRGTCRDYDNMLNAVATIQNVTPAHLYIIARDIVSHSDDGSGGVENVMFLLSRDAVRRFYYTE